MDIITEIEEEKQRDNIPYIPTPEDIARETERLFRERLAAMQASTAEEKHRKPYIKAVTPVRGIRAAFRDI